MDEDTAADVLRVITELLPSESLHIARTHTGFWEIIVVALTDQHNDMKLLKSQDKRTFQEAWRAI